MNVTEMHIAVQQGVDKINSLQADSLLSEEIDIELNKNMFRFINTKYGRNNLYQKGFEESQKRIDDLRTLVREFEAPVTFKEELKEGRIWVDTFTLPRAYMYLVNQMSKIWINNCKPIGQALDQTPSLSYFALDLNNFVLNNANGDSTAFVAAIEMVADITGTDPTSANIWSPSQALVNGGWSAFTYPQNIELIKQDILENPGIGFSAYWEQFETLHFPGHIIIIVDTDTHDWFEWDASIGTVSYATGVPADTSADSTISAPEAQPGQFEEESYSERRVPTGPYQTIYEGNRFSQQDDIFTLLNDPFNTTKHTSPLTTMRCRSIDIYTNDIFIIDTVKITYIREPNEISLSLGIDCELPEHTHQEIVD